MLVFFYILIILLIFVIVDFRFNLSINLAPKSNENYIKVGIFGINLATILLSWTYTDGMYIVSIRFHKFYKEIHFTLNNSDNNAITTMAKQPMSKYIRILRISHIDAFFRVGGSQAANTALIFNIIRMFFYSMSAYIKSIQTTSISERFETMFYEDAFEININGIIYVSIADIIYSMIADAIKRRKQRDIRKKRASY